jgi:hypothetical protein
MHAIDDMATPTLICRPDILVGEYRRACDFAVLLRAGVDTILVPAKLSAVRMLRVTGAQVVQCRAQSGQQLSGLWLGQKQGQRPRFLESHTGDWTHCKVSNVTYDLGRDASAYRQSMSLQLHNMLRSSITPACCEGTPLVFNFQLGSRCAAPCMFHNCRQLLPKACARAGSAAAATVRGKYRCSVSTGIYRNLAASSKISYSRWTVVDACFMVTASRGLPTHLH